MNKRNGGYWDKLLYLFEETLKVSKVSYAEVSVIASKGQENPFLSNLRYPTNVEFKMHMILYAF